MVTIRFHFEGEIDREVDADREDADNWPEAIGHVWDTIAVEEIVGAIYLTEESLVSDYGRKKARGSGQVVSRGRLCLDCYAELRR